eukprot:gene2090-biopygen3421
MEETDLGPYGNHKAHARWPGAGGATRAPKRKTAGPFDDGVRLDSKSGEQGAICSTTPTFPTCKRGVSTGAPWTVRQRERCDTVGGRPDLLHSQLRAPASVETQPFEVALSALIRKQLLAFQRRKNSLQRLSSHKSHFLVLWNANSAPAGPGRIARSTLARVLGAEWRERIPAHKAAIRQMHCAPGPTGAVRTQKVAMWPPENRYSGPLAPHKDRIWHSGGTIRMSDFSRFDGF